MKSHQFPHVCTCVIFDLTLLVAQRPDPPPPGRPQLTPSPDQRRQQGDAFEVPEADADPTTRQQVRLINLCVRPVRDVSVAPVDVDKFCETSCKPAGLGCGGIPSSEGGCGLLRPQTQRSTLSPEPVCFKLCTSMLVLHLLLTPPGHFPLCVCF